MAIRILVVIDFSWRRSLTLFIELVDCNRLTIKAEYALNKKKVVENSTKTTIFIEFKTKTIVEPETVKIKY